MIAAAAAVTFVMKNGNKKAEALRLVCPYLKPEQINVDTLDNFREKLLRGKVPGKAEYEKRLREAHEWAPGDPTKAIEALLTVLKPPTSTR
jgi:hypothetical protein